MDIVLLFVIVGIIPVIKIVDYRRDLPRRIARIDRRIEENNELIKLTNTKLRHDFLPSKIRRNTILEQEYYVKSKTKLRNKKKELEYKLRQKEVVPFEETDDWKKTILDAKTYGLPCPVSWEQVLEDAKSLIASAPKSLIVSAPKEIVTVHLDHPGVISCHCDKCKDVEFKFERHVCDLRKVMGVHSDSCDSCGGDTFDVTHFNGRTSKIVR
jgi:hypothetical protein